MDEQAELEKLAAELAELILGGLRATSQWAMRAALDASRTEGIAGVLSIKIPSKTKDLPDAIFCLGQVEVVTRWGA